MVMPATLPPKRWSARDVRALMESSPSHWPRYEVIDGALLATPAPRLAHQLALEVLRERLVPYLRQHTLGRLFASPADLELEHDTVVQPDLFVVPRALDRAREWKDVTGLLLAIEVASPRSRQRDRVIKRRFFQRVAVPEYWIVDLDEQIVERWRPRADTCEDLRTQLTWQPDPALAPLVIDLIDVFAEVDGR